MGKQIRHRIFVPGTPTKGRILEQLRKEITHFAYRWHANRDQFMDQQFWEEGEFDGVKGFFISVDVSSSDSSIKGIAVDERPALSDSASPRRNT